MEFKIPKSFQNLFQEVQWARQRRTEEEERKRKELERVAKEKAEQFKEKTGQLFEQGKEVFETIKRPIVEPELRKEVLKEQYKPESIIKTIDPSKYARAFFKQGIYDPETKKLFPSSPVRDIAEISKLPVGPERDKKVIELGATMAYFLSSAPQVKGMNPKLARDILKVEKGATQEEIKSAVQKTLQKEFPQKIKDLATQYKVNEANVIWRAAQTLYKTPEIMPKPVELPEPEVTKPIIRPEQVGKELTVPKPVVQGGLGDIDSFIKEAHSTAKRSVGDTITIGDVDITFRAETQPNTIRIENMEAFNKGEGAGSKVLDQFTKLADKHRVKIVANAEVTAEGGLDLPQLKDFYKRHGFKVDQYGQIERLPSVAQPPISEPKVPVKTEAEQMAEVEKGIKAEAQVEVKEARKGQMALKTGQDLQTVLNKMEKTKEGQWALPNSIEGKKIDWGEIAEDMGYTPTGITIEPKPGQVVDKLFYEDMVELKGGQPTAMGEKPGLVKVPKVAVKRIPKTLYDKLPEKFYQVVKDWETGKVTGVSVEPVKPIEEIKASKELKVRLKEERDFLRTLAKKPTISKKAENMAKIIRKATDDAIAGKVATKTTPAGNVIPIVKGGQTIAKPLVENASKLKDIARRERLLMDWERNFEHVFADRLPFVRKEFTQPYSAALTAQSDAKQLLENELEKEVIEKFDIHKGSKESDAIQRYGEKKITLEELKKKFPKKWENIIEADKFFRKKFNEILPKVNAVRKEMGKNEIEPLENYYRHFWELPQLKGFVEALKHSYETDPTMIGVSEYTKPTSKWLSFAQKRFGKEGYKYDAIGGYLNYIGPATYSIHIDPYISKFRALKDALSEQTKYTKNLNNFIWFLDRHANGLAGKTSGFDRPIEDFNPQLASLLKGFNIRIKNNIILGNLNPQLAQVLNLPQSLSTASVKNHLAASWEMAMQPFLKEDFPMENSGVLRRRSRLYKPFDPTLLERPKKLAGWIGSTLEEGSFRVVWGAQFRQATEQGRTKEEAILQADRETKRVMAMRGPGELPIAYQSRFLGGVGLAFQLEVGNAMIYYGDIISGQIPGDKGTKTRLTQLVKYMVFAWLFNNVYERVRGNRPLFDPIDAVRDALFEEDRTPIERVGRLVGETLSNVPGGQTLALLYPKEEVTISTEKGLFLPARRELLGEEFGGRFGVPPLASGFLKPELMIPPWGGAQAKKIADAWQAVKKGYYESPAGKERFPVEGMLDIIQSFLFGVTSIPAAQEYFDEMDKIQRLKARATREGKAEMDTALQLSRDLSSSKSPEESAKIMTEYRSSGRLTSDVLNKYVELLKGKAKGIGATEASLKGLSVEERAKLILREIDKIRAKDPSGVAPYLTELTKTGVLTKDVIAEMKRVSQEGEEYKKESPFVGLFEKVKEKFSGLFAE